MWIVLTPWTPSFRTEKSSRSRVDVINVTHLWIMQNLQKQKRKKKTCTNIMFHSVSSQIHITFYNSIQKWFFQIFFFYNSNSMTGHCYWWCIFLVHLLRKFLKKNFFAFDILSLDLHAKISRSWYMCHKPRRWHAGIHARAVCYYVSLSYCSFNFFLFFFFSF